MLCLSDHLRYLSPRYPSTCKKGNNSRTASAFLASLQLPLLAARIPEEGVVGMFASSPDSHLPMVFKGAQVWKKRRSQREKERGGELKRLPLITDKIFKFEQKVIWGKGVVGI